MTTFTTQDRQDAQRVPLTVSEIECIQKWAYKDFREQADYGRLPQGMDWPLFYARAIERAHGIGE